MQANAGIVMPTPQNAGKPFVEYMLTQVSAMQHTTPETALCWSCWLFVNRTLGPISDFATHYLNTETEKRFMLYLICISYLTHHQLERSQ